MAINFIRLDGDELLQKSIDAMPGKAKKAAKKALSITVKSAEQRIATDIVRQHRLPQSFKKNRVFSSVNGLKANVWVGGYSIFATQLGVMRQNKRGVRAGRHFFKGGFIAQTDSGHKNAWERKKVTTRWTKGRKRTSSPNLGIDKLRVKLSKIEKIVIRQQIKSEADYQKHFANELEKLL